MNMLQSGYLSIPGSIGANAYFGFVYDMPTITSTFAPPTLRGPEKTLMAAGRMTEGRITPGEAALAALRAYPAGKTAEGILSRTDTQAALYIMRARAEKARRDAGKRGQGLFYETFKRPSKEAATKEFKTIIQPRLKELESKGYRR
jgi:hypothetical protein